MFSKLGTEVALEMEQILSSDAHADLFYKQAAKTDTECDCPKNCACKQDGECKGACPCDKTKCKCPKGCDKCYCTETSGKCKCLKESEEDDDKKKKTDALQDISYTFSKVSADLDDAGYVKSSIAVLRALEGLIAEAQPKELSPEEDLPEFDSNSVSHKGMRGYLSDEAEAEPAPPEMTLEDLGTETFMGELEDVVELLESGHTYEATEMIDMLSQIIEEEGEVEEVAPPSVEDLMEPPQYKMKDRAPEDLGLGELENVITESELELDAWLQKHAGAVHRIDDPRDPELNIDLDLKDLLTAEDGVDTNLIDEYLSELEFEDE